MITIGAPLPSTEPLGLLTDCHRRIESALALLTAACHWPSSLESDQRAALLRALTYFREAAPRHTADEEESVFPRLRAQGELESLLSELKADHERAECWHESIDSVARAWAGGSVLSAEDRLLFTSSVSQLAGLYERHIRIEEEQIFPLARWVLTPEQQAQVKEEMAARRPR